MNYKSSSLGKKSGLAGVLRWAGSKRRVAPILISHLPSYWSGRYIEVFCGSACIFFLGIDRLSILSDLNSDLIDFYVSLRSSPISLYEDFASIPRTRETYVRLRERYNTLPSCYEKSVLFLYLNRNCFNGLFRTSTTGRFNVPFSDKRVPHYPGRDVFVRCAGLLEKADLITADFEEICVDFARPGDFVYLDPPYFVSHRRSFLEYSRHPFSIEDLRRLEKVLHVLHKRGCFFLLSYPSSAVNEHLCDKWLVSYFNTRRSISGNLLFRGETEECLIRNYDFAAKESPSGSARDEEEARHA